MNDKEKLEAIKKVLDDTPHHFFNRKGAVKDFEHALDEIKKIINQENSVK